MSLTEKKNFIAGHWVGGGDHLENINPSDTNDVIGSYASASSSDMAAAVAAAVDARSRAARATSQERADRLHRVGNEILGRAEELGYLLAREEGKTLQEGIGEANRAGQIFRFAAGEALRLSGDALQSVRPGVEVAVTREPVGVVGIITPWNFPLAIPAWKIAYALALGNSVVFKPAELVPGCAWELTSIIVRAGFDDGSFNLVMGKGAVVGPTLTGHAELDALSFTGSQGIGGLLAADAAKQGYRLQLEMGGKNPLIVLDDADLDVAVECAVQGGFFSTGQRCTASSRIIVTPGVREAFVDRLIEATRQLRTGHALSPSTQIGPVVDARQLDTDVDYVRVGLDQGAHVATGGERLELETPGFFLAPTVLMNTEPGDRVNQEEIFGPIVSVLEATDFDHALDIANGVPFGLVGGIVTSSLKYATEFRRRMQAGMVMVNLPTAGVDYHVPFGGTKSSSRGPREQGTYARDFYTTVKTAYIKH